MPESCIAANITAKLTFLKLKRWRWRLLVVISSVFVAAGQVNAVHLGRFYYDRGGNSKWMATLVQTAGFPILSIPLFLLRASRPLSTSSSSSSSPSLTSLAFIYFSLGVLVAGDNMLYSVGLRHLSVSTYSLICASQSAFSVIFSYFINSQNFTTSILNSVVVLPLSAVLIAVDYASEWSLGVYRRTCIIISFLTTFAASAIYSLILSLMQLSFQKVIKKQTLAAVLNMQICTALVATSVSIVGLFASGEWKTLHEEMEGFGRGQVSYVMTLVWTAVSWQIRSAGVVGFICAVSALFSNVMSTAAFATLPVGAALALDEKMNGVRVIAVLLALWGLAPFAYQNYKTKKTKKNKKAFRSVV